MNSVYIGAGLTIILALLAALVGPLFVDWTAYRAVFEREGTALIGRPVTVLGSADARLLPAPWIAFDDVVIGDLAHPLAKIGRFEMRLELTPLLKGELRVAEMHLDRPVVQVALGADGKVDLGPAAAAGGRTMAEVALEQAEITDGKLVLEDRRGGGTVAIGAINANASAAALVGPWKFEGGGAWGERPVTFRLASGRQGAEGAWPLKLQAGFADDPAQATFDATVSVADGRPNASGTLVVTRALPPNVEPAPEDLPPLRVEAKIKADAAGIVADQLDITVGAEDRAYLLSGTGGITLGAQPALEARLAAKQIDLDRALAGKVGEAVDVAETLSRGGTALRRLPQPPVPARLSLTLPGLVLGGGVVQDVRLEARSRPGGWAIDAIEAKLPGRTRFNADGRLALDERLGFDGAMKVVSDQPAAFANWWSRARDLPRLEPIDAEAKLSITPEAIKVDQLIARVGTATTRGFVEWAPGRVPAEGGRLRAGLTADRLDIDQVSALRTLMAGSAAPAGIGERRNGIGSAELDFDAGTLVVAGVALKGVSARGVVAEDVLSIDRFQVRDAAGASIEAHGRIERPATTPDGRIDLKLAADRPEALTRVVDALAGGAAWSKRLVAAAPALGPLAVNATLEGRASTSVSDVRATVNGTSAGSTLALDGRFTGRVEAWRDATVEVSGGLDGPDGARVLRQLGITALSFKGATGRVSATANGVPANGLDAAATVDIAGTRLGYVGAVKLPADGSVQFDGKATVAAKDVVQAALVLGQPLPGLDRTLGLDLAAKVSGAWPRLTFDELAGRAADTEVSGVVGVDFTTLPVAVSGRIGLGEVDLAGLAELGLGSGAFEAPLKAGEIWSGQPLGAPILGRSVRLDLDLTADRALIGSYRLDRAGLRLSTRVDEVGLEGLKAALGPGTAAGTLRIKRGSNGETTVSGDVKLAGIALEDIVWRRDGRSVATGRLDLDATFEGGGRSLAAIAAGLNGGGAVRVTAGMLRYVNPDAFRAIIVAADGGLDLKEDKVRTVFQSYLDNGQMPFDRLDAAFSMAGGVARAGEAVVESALARTRGSVAFDLARWKLDADWTLTVDPGKGNTVTGAQAQVGVVFSGPLDRPSRRLDVAPLAAFLTLRAFEREVARIEAMQADIMERERFARELRRLRQENARRVQEQQAEEARKADEARKAAEAARKAEEERKRQLEAPKPAGQIDPPAGGGSTATATSNGRATTAQANEVGPNGASGQGATAAPNAAPGPVGTPPGAGTAPAGAAPAGAAPAGAAPAGSSPSPGPSSAAEKAAVPPAAPDALPPLDPTIQIAPAPPVLGSPRPATGGSAPLVLSPSGTQ